MEAFGKSILAVIIALIIFHILKHHWSMRPIGGGKHQDHYDEGTYDPGMKETYDPSIM